MTDVPTSTNAFKQAAEVTQPDARAINLLENVYLTPVADLTPLQVSGLGFAPQNVQWSASAIPNNDGGLTMQGFSTIYRGADGNIHTANMSTKPDGSFALSVDGIMRNANGQLVSVVSGREENSITNEQFREGANFLNSTLSFAGNDKALKDYPDLQQQVSDMARVAYAQSPLADMQMHARGASFGGQ